MYCLSLIFCMPFTDIIILIMGSYMFSINCKSPRAVHLTGKMLHIQGGWKRLLLPITQIFSFKPNASLHLSVTYILPLSILLYIMYNPLIVIGTNYFVLLNDCLITV